VSQLTLYNGASRDRDRPQGRSPDKVGAIPNRPVAARSAPRSDPPAPTPALSAFFILPSTFPPSRPRNCGDRGGPFYR
jgi:hypothetical protein